MLAFAREQHGADVIRQRREELFDADDRLVIERVAFVRAVELQHGDTAVPLRGKRGRHRAAKTSDDISLLLISRSTHHHVVMNLLVQRSVLDQGAAAFIQRSERLVGRDCPHDPEDIPLALRFGRCFHLQQVHWVDLAAVGTDDTIAEQRILCRHRLHGRDNRAAVQRRADFVDGLEIVQHRGVHAGVHMNSASFSSGAGPESVSTKRGSDRSCPSRTR